MRSLGQNDFLRRDNSGIGICQSKVLFTEVSQNNWEGRIDVTIMIDMYHGRKEGEIRNGRSSHARPFRNGTLCR